MWTRILGMTAKLDPILGPGDFDNTRASVLKGQVLKVVVTHSEALEQRAIAKILLDVVVP